MAKKLKVESICERELLEKILRIVERQEKLPTANKAVSYTHLTLPTNSRV